MKILSIILLVIGGLVNFTSEKTANWLFKDNENIQSKKLAIKFVGLVIVFAAAIVAFCN